MKLAYFADVGPGGLSTYAVHQAAGLAAAGVELHFLGLPHMRESLLAKAPNVIFHELLASQPAKQKWQRAVQAIRNKRRHAQAIARILEEYECQHVLISSFSEYFAPLWVDGLQDLQRQGIRFGVVVHDPIRDFRIGPNWWHQRSIGSAYSFIDVAFTHDATTPDTGSRRKPLRTCVIPHGIYTVPDMGCKNREQKRSELNILPHSKVWLSFGHIRDAKNLDIVIQALREFPDDILLVVGREQSESQKPIGYYQDLASQLGVADRCRWVNQFVPESEVAEYFHVADQLILLYSSDFRSASGVLSAAAQFGIDVLASGGSGPLQHAVETYQLGVFVAPDSLPAAVEGLRRLQKEPTQADWETYRQDHSWETNAHAVLDALASL